MTKRISFKLIGRQGCHLCEDARGELARIIGELNVRFPDLEYVVEDLDVDENPDLFEKFSDEVPVLLLDEKQIAFFKIDASRVLAAIEEKL